MTTSSRYSTRLREANEVVDFGRCGDAEKIDPPASVGAKVAALAGLIKSARRVVVHTGAGISTAAGIPDFRGPDGDWTRLMQHQPPLPCTIDAGPTLAHLALKELVRRGLVHHVVTQNVDGLHEKSGLPRDCLSEIHGSCFGHYCYECGTLYPTWEEVDGFGCQPVVPPLRCARMGCGQLLHDRVKSWASILPLAEMKRAEEEHSRADLVIVLGCSLRVAPANELLLRTLAVSQEGEGRFHPLTGRWEAGKAPGHGGQLVIVNLQTTEPRHRAACLRVHGRCDTVLAALLDALGLPPVGPWDRPTCRAAFDAHAAAVLHEARSTPRNVNNGRWPRGHPCVRVDDIPCCVCGDAGPCARDSFLLCSDCNVGAHVSCLLTGQKRRCRRRGGGDGGDGGDGGEGGAEGRPLAVVSPPPPQRDGDDWLCGFCLREGER